MTPAKLATIRERAEKAHYYGGLKQELSADIRALLDHIADLTKQLTIKSESSALIRDSLRDLLEKLDSRLAGVLALHTPVGAPDQYCQHCEHNAPCPTQRAANGDPPDEPHVPYLDTN